MQINKILKSVVASVLVTGFAASAWAADPQVVPGTWVKETTLFGLQNAYVYVPKNTAPATIGTGRALMLSLHGCGMTATNVINKGFNWETTAEQYGMIVVAPTVPSGTTSTRSYSGCWDWFGGNHSRSTRDEAILLKLVGALIARKELNIDPAQVYISGLSSGAGVVNTLGCVAPDVFAGVGDNAGPALYTASSAGVGSKAQVTAQNVSDVCTQIAGSYSGSLKTQIFSAVNGTADYTVDPTHDKVEVAGMKINYGATIANGTFTDVQSTGELWKDAAGKTRVSYVQATGMGHAWPAGAGGSGGGTYVGYKHINYPAYVTKFFFENNLRVCRDTTVCPPGSTTTTTSTINTTQTTAPTTSTTSTSSAAVTTTTTTSTTQAGTACFTSSNVAHVAAGRAYYSFGYTRAFGSYAQMGLYNSSTITTLKKVSAYYYVLGGC